MFGDSATMRIVSSIGFSPSGPQPTLVSTGLRTLVPAVGVLWFMSVAMRNERREAIEKLKRAEKAKEIAEDARKKQEEAVQKLTDLYIKKVDETLAAKEKELSTI